jgi:HD superfamily phosphodiesterase
MRMGRNSDLERAIGDRYPGLLDRIKARIEKSEREFGGKAGGKSHLWGHTIQVASLAFQLAKAEKTDPLLPTIAALIHDAGKFAGRRIHSKALAEEEASVRIGVPILRRAGLSVRDIRSIATGLNSLYRQGARKNRIADVVHDADFLSKFGALGVANFFIKSTLRGETLESAVCESLSKELTYAACLPANMRTKAGRSLAEKRSRDSLRFFRSLLRELRQIRALDLRISRHLAAPASRPGEPIEIRLVLPRSCGRCGSKWTTAFRTERGIKCERLEVEILCPRCGRRSGVSFCLPEIAGKSRQASRTQ